MKPVENRNSCSMRLQRSTGIGRIVLGRHSRTCTSLCVYLLQLIFKLSLCVNHKYIKMFQFSLVQLGSVNSYDWPVRAGVHWIGASSCDLLFNHFGNQKVFISVVGMHVESSVSVSFRWLQIVTLQSNIREMAWIEVFRPSNKCFLDASGVAQSNITPPQ